MLASLLLMATTCVGEWTVLGSPPEDPDYRVEARCATEANGFHYVDLCGHTVGYTSGRELGVQCTGPCTVVVPR